MFEIPETTGADLVGFGLLAAALLLFGVLRLVRPDASSWRTGARLGLWFAIWQGGGLVLRMTGFA